MAKKIVTPSTVRAFFGENPDLIPTGDVSVKGVTGKGRGRLSKAATEAYQKATGHKVTEKVAKVVDLKVPTTDAKGRKITKTVKVTPATLRTLAEAEGHRGRISAAGLTKAADNYLATLKG